MLGRLLSGDGHKHVETLPRFITTRDGILCAKFEFPLLEVMKTLHPLSGESLEALDSFDVWRSTIL